MTEMDILKVLLDEIRAVREDVHKVRNRLDAHVDDEKANISIVKGDIAKLHEEIIVNKVSLSMMAGGIALVFTALLNWFMGMVGTGK